MPGFLYKLLGVLCCCIAARLSSLHLCVQVLKHPEFLTGKATTSFIGDNPQLFEFRGGSEAEGQSSKVLQFLADQVS